jgi:hypothetical protein
LFTPPSSAVETELSKLDVDRITPIEALMILRDLRSKLP